MLHLYSKVSLEVFFFFLQSHYMEQEMVTERDEDETISGVKITICLKGGSRNCAESQFLCCMCLDGVRL